MTWTLRYCNSTFVRRCCFTSWSGRCCEYPLDHEAEEPESTNHYSNWFSINPTTTEESSPNSNKKQYHFSNIFDAYRERMMRVRELPIEYQNGIPKKWWSEFK